MVFQYKVRSRPKIQIWGKDRPVEEKIEEDMTGYVRGKRAYATEERFAKALDKSNKVDRYWFSVIVESPYQIPGEQNEVDFYVWSGGTLHPIEIDGGWVHKTGDQRSKDVKRDAILNPIIQQRNPGAMPIERIPDILIETQEKADKLVRELFYG